MRYDFFDSGLSLFESPVSHRKYKCKICKEYFKPSFQVNALWCGYWRCDHIKFCYEHTGEQIDAWLSGHIKKEDWTIPQIVNAYLKQQKVLDSEKELNKILVTFNQS